MQRLGMLRPFHRQRGVTLLGWLFLLIPLGVVCYAVIRLTPVYLNYMRVARSVEETASSFRDGENANTKAIRSTLEKHFAIDSIDFPSVNDVTITRSGDSWVIEAKYQDVAPLFANLSLTVDFDKVSQTGGG